MHVMNEKSLKIQNGNRSNLLSGVHYDECKSAKVQNSKNMDDSSTLYSDDKDL